MLSAYSSSPPSPNNKLCCVVIHGNKPSSSPPTSAPTLNQLPATPIPNNANSTRAHSKRNRIFVFRDFLLRKYPFLTNAADKEKSDEDSNQQPNEQPTRTVVLDIAGGRGDLSFLLRNVDGIDSVIIDPRGPNFKSWIKSVKFLLDHPDEAKKRSIEENGPIFQPLAKLLPRLVEQCGNGDGGRNGLVQITAPRNLRIHVNDELVHTIRMALSSSKEEENLRIFSESPSVASGKNDDDDNENEGENNTTTNNSISASIWNTPWKDGRSKESNESVNGVAASKRITPTTNTSWLETKPANTIVSSSSSSNSSSFTPSFSSNASTLLSNEIHNSQTALSTILSANLIVGFHPDQATEAMVDLALLLRVPFAVVPCCVFPKEFPDRVLMDDRIKIKNCVENIDANGLNGDGEEKLSKSCKSVRTHAELVEYLKLKHPKIREESLQFVETVTAKRVVLYMLEEDYHDF